jgi:hypothetical protein
MVPGNAVGTAATASENGAATTVAELAEPVATHP